MRLSTTSGPMSVPSGRWARVDRAWRLVGTALSFTVFGLAGIVLSVTVVPAIWLFFHPRERRERAGRWLVSKAFATFVWTMNALGVLRYRIAGDVSAAEGGGCLIVANHPSLIDVVFLLAIFQRADCVVKAAQWTNPFMMAVVSTAGFVPNRQPDEVMATCIERLKAGRTIVLFPEGTRTVPGKPFRLPRGAATIAVRAGARCLPVRLSCTPTTLTKAEPWYHIPVRRVLFEVNILAPVDSRRFLDACDSERQASFALNEELARLLEPTVEFADGSFRI